VGPDGNIDIVAICVSVLVPDSVIETGAVAAAFPWSKTVISSFLCKCLIDLAVRDDCTSELNAMSIFDGMDYFVASPGSAFNGSADSHASPLEALGLFGASAIFNIMDTMFRSVCSDPSNLFSIAVSIIAYSIVFGVDDFKLDIFGDIHICGTRTWSLANVSNSGPELAICVFSLIWAWAMLPVESAMIIR